MKSVTGLLLSSLLSGLLLGGCAGFGGPEPTATPVASEPATVERVVADARVVPVESVELAFQIPGTVEAILVHEGDTVTAGQPLARLESADLELQVEQARAALERAKAQLVRLSEGATSAELADAEARLEQAEAGLRQAAGSVTRQDVVAARDRLAQARATLARLEAGPKSTEAESARAALNQARANLQSQRDALSAAKTQAELQLEQAANTLRNAQDAYSRVYWENREREKLPGDLPQEAKDAEAAALRTVKDAETALEQARVALEQAQQAEITGIQASESNVRDAQARLDQLLAGADADAIAAARAQISQAQAELARLTGAERAAQIDAAEAAVASARAMRDQVAEGPRESELEVARADVRAAEVAVRQAGLSLDKATLRTPIAGTVAEINLTVGEQPDLTMPAVVIADLSSWKIETRDLTELGVVSISEGDSVIITFDALPELELSGEVTEIKRIGQSVQGDINYTVVIAPRQWDPRLRWNMTATVAIEPSLPPR